MKIYKEDYKHFRVCQKLVWFLNGKNYEMAKKMIEDKKIINFVELINTETSSKFYSKPLINDIDEIDLNNDANFVNDDEEYYLGETLADGLETGRYAQKLFESKYRCYNLDNDEQKKSDVFSFLNDQQYDVFFEPRFEYDDCVTKCDILKRNGNGWDLIEVKAVTWVKEEHMWDLLYQYYILTKLGLKINNLYIMHLNNNYVLEDEIDLAALFVYSTIWQKSSKAQKTFALFETIQMELTSHNLADEFKIIKNILQINDLETALNLLFRECCHEKQKEWCFHIFPYFDPFNTIFQLYRLRKKKKALWFYEENLLKIDDHRLIPFIIANKMHQRQYQVCQNSAAIIDFNSLNALKKILARYQYPVYMYDFETMKAAIPKFKNSRPYQQIPFQYSVHVLLSADFDFNTNKNIVHYYFLADGETDPRSQLITNFCRDMLEIHELGVYVAYNESFEKSIIKNLIQYMPEKVDDLTKIWKKTIDLQDFFKDFKIYKPQFCGSLSIKKTLPAFDQHFSYEDLKIKKGDVASEIFRRRVENNITLENWHKKFRQYMIEYCNHDTLGMVVLFWHIKNLIIDTCNQQQLEK